MTYKGVKMINNLKFRHKALFPFILAVILILVTLIVTYFETSQNKFKNITSKFQNEFLEQEKLGEIVLNKINLDFLNQKSDSSGLISFLNRNEYSIPGQTFLIFRDDTLVFWSSNKVSLGDVNINEISNQSVIELSNGYYYANMLAKDNNNIVGLTLIKNQYVFENQYLINKFNSCFQIPTEVKLQFDENQSYKILNRNGGYLFCLDYSEINLPLESALNSILVLHFIIYILLLFSLYHAYLELSQKTNKKGLLILAFLVDVLLFRYIILYFEFPHILYKSALFSPDFLASSKLFASTGDLLLNAITACFLAVAIFKSAYFKIHSYLENKLVFYLFGSAGLFFVYFMFHWMFEQIFEIILNSTISFNLSNISGLSLFTQLGVLGIGILLFSAFLIAYRIIIFIINYFKSFVSYISFSSVSLFLFLFIFYTSQDVWINLILLLVLLLSIWYFEKFAVRRSNLSKYIFLILLFSLYTTAIFQYSNTQKEYEKRDVFAEKLLLNRDPIVEYEFKNISEEIVADTLLIGMLKPFPFQFISDQENIDQYLIDTHFSKLLDKYEILLTLCDSGKILKLQPNDFEINCLEYFDQDIIAYGKSTDCEELYYMDYELDDDNYLGKISLRNKYQLIQLYVELFPKNVPKGLGYPELLSDKKVKSDFQMADYSFAKFEDGQLINWFGRYFYSSNFIEEIKNPSNQESIYIDKNGYNHLVYYKDSRTVLVVSKKNPTWLDFVTPFSYLSIFFGLTAFILIISIGGGGEVSLFPLSFKKRVQLVITSLIIFSFLLVGVGSLFHLISINDQKNTDFLKEKAHSVLVELEHKLALEKSLPPSLQSYLNDLLYKFSLVFFSDINLYSLDGKILASSRPEIFHKGLISSQMNPDAYAAIHIEGSSFLIQNEQIGDYQYLSAFIPFRNSSNQLIAYINLPYFAKQDELTNEISTFLVAFINIYIIFIALAIYLSLIISNYITRPLQLLKEKIGGLKLGKAEAKIAWNKNDEIGELVIEYNRMVDMLVISAEKLAKSERETAWREMAKQIAHEIKNPLTPMKLSVQYLQKAWDDQLPDWDLHLKRFTQTIVEQINSLSIIASEFSDFAKMPRSKFREIDLVKVVQSAIDLFIHTTEIQFKFDFQNDCIVYADKEQLLRLFNNLIKNSIQAISDEKKGVITISVIHEKNACKVIFSDNGKGIPEEEQSKVFYPNFTTKTGGMGLGLAMVKNILENANGTISFSSVENEGTTFIILLPLPPLSEK